jgi:maltose alpha-D-glucosyltransferase/alpha-amylase
LIKAMKATEPRPATAQWGMFLRNHDELDLDHTKTNSDHPTAAAASK